MKNIEISVVLATYNDGKYIKEAIESILNQSYKHFEFIIINDGSTDDTERKILSYSDPRIRYVKHNTNRGLIYSLNEGFSLARNQWVARMDGDDVAHKNRLKEQIKHIDESVSLISTNAVVINEKGTKIGKTNFSSMFGFHNIYFVLGFNPVLHPTCLINKRIYLKVGGYDSNFQHSEDLDLFLRMSNYGKIKIIRFKSIFLRKHDSNISLLKSKEQKRNSRIALLSYLANNKSKLSEKQYDDLSKFLDSSFFLRTDSVLNRDYKIKALRYFLIVFLRISIFFFFMLHKKSAMKLLIKNQIEKEKNSTNK